jgi:hypothetical protein
MPDISGRTSRQPCQEEEQEEEEPLEVKADRPTPVPICEYFHRGKCTFGDNCVKSHDPLPLYKKDLKDVVLKTAAEAAAEKRAATQGASVGAAVATAGRTKVKTTLVKIVKNTNGRTAPTSATGGTSMNNNSGATNYRTTAATTTTFVKPEVSRYKSGRYRDVQFVHTCSTLERRLALGTRYRYVSAICLLK